LLLLPQGQRTISSLTTALLVILTFFSIYYTPQSTVAQAQLRASTNGKAVDVLVEPVPAQPDNSELTKFMITFLEPGTDTVKQHIDYDVSILKGDKELYRASGQDGQPPLHTAEGKVTVPFKFADQGNDYSIRITVSGIRFIPINPESVTFPINVTPEFPFALLTAAASMSAVMAMVTAKIRKNGSLL
jgi:hypothetical protein